MIGSCLAGKFWAGAIFNAAEIVNMQYRVDFRISPRESLHWTKPDVNLALLAVSTEAAARLGMLF